MRIFFSLALLVSAARADSLVVNLRSTNATAILEWQSQLNLPLAGMLPQYKIESSADLLRWQPLDSPIHGAIGADQETVRYAFPRPAANSFYRVSASAETVDGGRFPDAMYGYASQFNKHLAEIGQIPLDEFVRRYAVTNQFRAALSFDPTTARYWTEFNTDPAVWNATNSTQKRLNDFRFNADEFAIFKTNGFVVSQRLGSYSFADAFYSVFINDLPIYVSSDALLHAWHRDYVSILAEIAMSFLNDRLGAMVTNMSSAVSALNAEAVGGPLEVGVLDADYFLAVSKSLLGGTNDPGQLNQGQRVQAALDAIYAEQPVDFMLFGSTRAIDFSQFKPRGHYANFASLQKYFRAVMWCGSIDFQFWRPAVHAPREFSGAVALTLLLDRANQRDNWVQFDQTIRTFVGLPDCMNFGQLADLLAAGHFAAPYDTLDDIYARIWSGDLGVQNIRSGYFYSPLSAQQLRLPRSFAAMPQRFILDSWSFSKTVFDSIIWDENGIPEFTDKVERRIPSGLDVAFAVFANNQIVPEIAARIADKNGRLFRDGLPYQHNLAALRECIDDHDPAYWTNNIYAAWLSCLRALSEPTTAPSFPEAFQNRAFALNSLNTQLASWTELRHDTILYARQSSTAGESCSYPFGYVEPRPEFWGRLAAMAQRTGALLNLLPDTGGKSFEAYGGGPTFTPMSQLKTNWVGLMDRFATAATMLRSIAEQEIDHAELDADQIGFLQDVIDRHQSYASGGRSYSGWYPQLFFKPIEHNLAWGVGEGSDIWNPVITDVHTDIPDVYSGDAGCILHEAVGNVNMAFIVINCDGDQPLMYAGPVMSHYEFELGPSTRATDDDWKATIKNNQQPQPSPWTQSFLVPGKYTIPSNIY